MKTINNTYHFRTAKDGIKRPSVTTQLNVPDTSDIAPNSGLLATLIERTVADYCKVQFIDKGLAVGAHDWLTIEAAWQAAQEASGGFTSCPYSDEDFKAAQAIFSAHLDKVAPKFAPLASKVIANRAAKRQVESCLSKVGVSSDTMTKLMARIVETCEAAQGADDNAVGALVYCAERVQAHIDALATATIDADEM